MDRMQIVEVRDWSRSANNNPIALFKSSPEPKNPIILIGGVHGDEPEGVWLAEFTFEWLKRNTVKLPWILIPCLNPDGFAARTRGNGHGVDLNRNYPSRDWSPHFEKPRYNSGPSAGSEPEVQALVRLIQDCKPRLLIHFHSWQPCIVCTGDPGLLAGRALAESSGYELKNDIGYPTPGSLSGYGWHDNKIPVICVEEAEGCARENVWPHFKRGIEKIFSGALK